MAMRKEVDKDGLRIMNNQSFKLGMKMLQEEGKTVPEVVKYLRQAYQSNWEESGEKLEFASQVHYMKKV